MEELNIEQTVSTPAVIYNENENTLKIIGKSYPENPAGFYDPIFDWLRKNLGRLDDSFKVIFHLVYLNTSSSKALMTLLDILEEVYQMGKSVIIDWYYDSENEFAMERGEDFKEDLELPFNLLEI